MFSGLWPPSGVWVFVILMLRYNSYSVTFILLKEPVQWFVVCSPSGTAITTV